MPVQKVATQKGQTNYWQTCMIVSRINNIAPPPVFLPEHPFPRPRLSNNYLSVLVLNCPSCVDILAQPIQVPCSTLTCAQCVIQEVPTTVSVYCPCCLFSQQPIVLPLHQPASHLTLLLVKDIVVVHCCVSCNREIIYM